MITFPFWKVIKYRRKKKKRRRKYQRSPIGALVQRTGEVGQFLAGSEKGKESEGSSAPEESEMVTPKAQKPQRAAESVKKINEEVVGMKENLNENFAVSKS